MEIDEPSDAADPESEADWLAGSFQERHLEGSNSSQEHDPEGSLWNTEQVQLEGDKATTRIWKLAPSFKTTGLQLQSWNLGFWVAPSNRRTTDVETTTFISIENRRVEEPIHFTTY